MLFAAMHVPVNSVADGSRLIIPGQFVHPAHVFFDLGETGSGNHGFHFRAAQAGDFPGNTDGLEQLGTAIAGHRTDAHLGEDFQQAFADAATIVFPQLDRVTLQGATFNLLVDRLECQVGVYRGGAQSEQHGVLVGVTHRSGFNHQVRAGALVGAHQRLVYRAYCQRRRDGQPFVTDVAIAEHQDGDAAFDRCQAFCHQGINGAAQTVLLRVIIEAVTLVAIVPLIQAQQGLVFNIIEDRPGQDYAVRMRGGFVEHVVFPPDAGFQRTSRPIPARGRWADW